jgi:hypothetical protein
MSRVEPKHERQGERRETKPRRRELSDRKPEKAEGDERTIEEALKNQEHK